MSGRKLLPTHLKLVKGTRPGRSRWWQHRSRQSTLMRGTGRICAEMAGLLSRHAVITELDTGTRATWHLAALAGAEQEVKRRSQVVEIHRPHHPESASGCRQQVPGADGTDRKRVRADAVEPLARRSQPKRPIRSRSLRTVAKKRNSRAPHKAG